MKFSEKTFKEKRSMFKIFFKVIDPDLPPIYLTKAKVLSYIQNQMKERSGYGANKDRKNLVAAWNWGMNYMEPALPSPNPCQVLKMPEKRSKRYVPPEAEFWKVFKLTEGQDRIMLLTFLHTAGRRGEIFRLKWDDLNFENGQLRFWTHKRKDGSFEFDWIPMTGKLMEALGNWREERPIKDSPYVFLCLDKTPFCSEYYGKPFLKRAHLMERLCEKAGVRRFGFHAIRHLTTASILYNDGAKLADIQSILRHKSPGTTERYLRSFGIETARAALENNFGDRG